MRRRAHQEDQPLRPRLRQRTKASRCQVSFSNQQYHSASTTSLFTLSTMLLTVSSNKLNITAEGGGADTIMSVGTFIIDPSLPSSSFTSPSDNREKMPLDKKNKMFILNKKRLADVYFGTTHGSLSLNLTLSDGTEKQVRSCIQVESRHGRINVTMVRMVSFICPPY